MIVGLFILIVAAVLGWQVFSPRSVPQGQPPMVDLDQGNFKQFEKNFDDSAQQARVVALLSPT